MSNIIDSIQLSGVTYTLSAQTSGEGKSVEAGRGISVASGTSAYTVSFNLPISAGTGSNSIAEGNNTAAIGDISHAEGDGTMANGISSHAEGASTTASGICSHAEGYYTQARGDNSHAEGNNTQARGNDSHAEGYGTIAAGNCSHAEGYETIISSNYSHAEGYNTSVDGSYSHAEGYLTLASSIYSHAEGNNTRAINQSEHASGQYNVSNNASYTFGNSGNTLFSVGNGTSNSARHNAFEIRQNGDIYLSSGGTDIKLQDHLGGGGNPTVELTQAEYDALVSGGTVDPTAFYIITDAVAFDPSTKVDTSAITSSVTSASTNSEIPTAKAVYDAIPQGGGGKAVSGGTNISITTGETADTINCTIPYVGEPNYRIYYGYATTNKSKYSLVIGGRCNTTSDTQNNIVVGYDCHSRESHNAVFGVGNYSNNRGEISSGFYNVSNSGSTDADKTLFSVGNGTSTSARHNAFEIRQNGDIYCSDGTNDVKLQDTITATASNTTALGGLKLVKLTQSEYDALATKDNSTLYVVTDS